MRLLTLISGTLLFGAFLIYSLWPTYVYLDSHGLYHSEKHARELGIEYEAPPVVEGRAKLLGYEPDECITSP